MTGASVGTAGLESREVAGERGRYRLLSWVDAAILVAAVFVMTVKPI